MLSNTDKAEIMRLIADAKEELRKEIWDASNRNHEDKTRMKGDTAITFTTLAEGGAIDDVTAAEHSTMFSEWQIGIAYKQGNIRNYNGKLFKCLQAHTSQDGWQPDVAPSLWKAIGDPTDEFPEWSQPVGAGDGYAKGDKVSHNGSHWVSTFDGENVWEPGVFGWEIILTEE